MKKQKIDKTHWIIQFSVLTTSFVLFLFLPKILDLKEIFPKETTYTRILLPSLLLIFSAFLGIFLKKDNKPFTKSWIFNDFTYWNIFTLLLSLIAIFHFTTSNSIHGIFTQIFAYISLLLGYANELRNEIIKEKGKK
ncbi:MAG TPA: hypothetical protein VJY47_03130 [Candidatus Dojkabacteria bacterium]|nr:hypothetical protein [Candidatus Dojkabacteria bacterium]